jgi:hypothetical protein
MYFRPIDEISLRHLFSSGYAENELKMSYLGPVLNQSGVPETSPDCLILDKRNEPWRILRCEFKYSPSSKKEFEQNGQFDIAIVWSISPPLTKSKLKEELLQQNGCYDIVVLVEYKAFSNLDEYSIPTVEEFSGINDVREIIRERERYATVYAAYIAAKIYPKGFPMDRMVNTLANKFSEVRKLKPQGRANIVSSLMQTKPPLIKWRYGNIYSWNGNDINAKMAAIEIERIIRGDIHQQVPDAETIDSFEKDDLC